MLKKNALSDISALKCKIKLASEKKKGIPWILQPVAPMGSAPN